jgi:hypothetical protein
VTDQAADGALRLGGIGLESGQPPRGGGVNARITAPMATATEPLPSRQLDGAARLDSGIRFATGILLWLGLLLVTYWWDADGGVTDLAHWTSGLTSVGRLTGLWSERLVRAAGVPRDRIHTESFGW